MAAIRPGGILEAPLLGDDEERARDPHGEDARGYALVRVVHGAWGIPERTGSQLVDEVRAAGFVDVAAVTTADGLVRHYAVRP